MTRTGHCLCGAVSFSGDIEAGIQACHCGECQRWTGGGPLFAVRVRNLQIAGETTIASYHHSAHGERAFCRTCGSTLYWRMQGHPIAFVSPGLLDDQSGMAVTEEIFVDKRPEWFPLFAGAKQSTEAEMQAQLQAFLAKDAAP